MVAILQRIRSLGEDKGMTGSRVSGWHGEACLAKHLRIGRVTSKLLKFIQADMLVSLFGKKQNKHFLLQLMVHICSGLSQNELRICGGKIIGLPKEGPLTFYMCGVYVCWCMYVCELVYVCMCVCELVYVCVYVCM